MYVFFEALSTSHGPQSLGEENSAARQYKETYEKNIRSKGKTSRQNISENSKNNILEETQMASFGEDVDIFESSALNFVGKKKKKKKKRLIQRDSVLVQAGLDQFRGRYEES